MSLIENINDKSIKEDNEWIAVKSFNNVSNNSNQEILNLVSLSVENEKIILVAREHNRVVTDDKNTEQWYGVFSVEEFFTIHQQFIQIDQTLDVLYPKELKPIKGYIFTYFQNDLLKVINNDSTDKTKNLDLQDNILCNSITLYLNRAFESVGKNLYVDILFNDINSNQYFEIYSEFSLKRLKDKIEQLKLELEEIYKSNNKLFFTKKNVNNNKSLTKSQFDQIDKKINLKVIFDTYSKEEKVIDSLLKLYAEYYNSTSKPLNDSRELSKLKLSKYEKKLSNLEKTNKYLKDESIQNALNELKNNINKYEEEIKELSNNVDSLFVELKENCLCVWKKSLESLNSNKKQICLTKDTNLEKMFELLTKRKSERIENEIIDKKIQMYKLQINILEREKEKTSSINENLAKIIQTKLLLYNEEENFLKKKLNDIKYNVELKNFNMMEFLKSYDDQLIIDLKEHLEANLTIDFKNEYLYNRYNEFGDFDECNVDENENDDDSDEMFFDAHEDKEGILDEEKKEKQMLNNKMSLLKKKILSISSKKSSLRLNLARLEDEKNDLKASKDEIKEKVVKDKSEAQNKENISNKVLFIESRKKAIQRLKEYKLKQNQTSLYSSNDSISSVSTTNLTTNIKNDLFKISKKPYIPKSKQRILPPGFGKRTNKVKSNQNKISLQAEDLKIESESPMQDPYKNSSSINAITIPPAPPLPIVDKVFSIPIPPTPPPPPPLPTLKIDKKGDIESNIISTKPIEIPIPPPPPPPPAPPLPINDLIKKDNIELKHKKIEQNSKINKESANVKSFDINEIKNFKFNKSKKPRSPPKERKPQENSWNSLMDEIKSANASSKLRKVSLERKKSKSKVNNDDLSESKLIRDLNLIIAERSKFFNENDEDDSSSDSWDS